MKQVLYYYMIMSYTSKTKIFILFYFHQIIKEFDFIPEDQRPLILGLTATVLNSNASGTLSELEELQRNMKSVFAKTNYLVEAIK